MDSLIVSSINRLNINDCLYKGMACDKCFIYFTLPQCLQVHSYNKCLVQDKIYNTCHKYGAICFDSFSNCFWALDFELNNRIYKLDCCFNELCYIDVCCLNCCDTIKGICAFDYECLSIFNGSRSFIIRKTDGTFMCEADSENNICNIIGTKIGGGVKAVIYSSPFGQIIRVKPCCTSRSMECILPCGICISDLCICPGKGGKGETILYAFGNKNECCGTALYVVTCKYTDNRCNIPCCDACINEILESVAQVEASISRILTAEGDKINKILSSTNNPCDIINVNKSVNDTIINMTHLEQSLYSKLLLCRSISENTK